MEPFVNIAFEQPICFTKIALDIRELRYNAKAPAWVKCFPKNSFRNSVRKAVSEVEHVIELFLQITTRDALH